MSINDLVSYHTIAQAKDPFQPYSSQGWGKGGNHPVTPEPSTYGALLMTSILTLLIYDKYIKRKK
jgi:hypothetical protein